MSEDDEYLPPDDLASLHRWLAAVRRNPSAYIRTGRDSAVERAGERINDPAPDPDAWPDPLTAPLPQGHKRLMVLVKPVPGRYGEWEMYEHHEIDDIMRERAAHGLK